MVWFGIRSQRKETLDRIAKVEDNYVPTEVHTLMCANSSLELRKHISEEMATLKNEICTELRELKGIVERNGKRA